MDSSIFRKACRAAARIPHMRIYDTFLFDGELDLLDHRLQETFDLVDIFVLVEATETFRGHTKRLVFREKRARFAWAAGKIRYIALDTLGPAGRSPWEREILQRNAIQLGLRDAAQEDIVLILDADEIVARSLLERLRDEGLNRPHRLAMTRHYECLDLLAPGSPCCPSRDNPFPFAFGRVRPKSWASLDATWYQCSGVVVRFEDLVGNPSSGLPPRSAYDMRRLMHAAPALDEAGRHFISTDPAARTESKLTRVSHEELADSRALMPGHLKRARRYAIHHRGWWYAEVPGGELPPDLQRLAERCPAGKRQGPLPPPALRLLMRTWAWLRCWPRLGDSFVQAVDRHFEQQLPVLAAPLLAAELLRHVSAQRKWRWLRFASPVTGDPGHSHG
jgi:beta-1,4-mannosyl-glycoprotein beta-1,4-N-acetylglucosaminyltransferase